MPVGEHGVGGERASTQGAAHMDGHWRVNAAQSGWVRIDWPEMWGYRELLYFLVWKEVKVRYKQTVLGVAWAVLQPVMTMIVFSIFFGRLAGLGRATGAYPIRSMPTRACFPGPSFPPPSEAARAL